MSTSKKLLEAASGGAGGDKLTVDQVFSTNLYAGTNSSQSIVNGIDLANKGGLVWVKSRTTAFDHMLADTETGAGKFLSSNTIQRAIGPISNALTSFNSNGFSIGSYNDYNYSGDDIASWSFRKAPKFFDIQTWSGNSTNRQISHSLNSNVGMIIAKCTSITNTNWQIFHKDSNASSPGNYRLEFTTGAAQANSQIWNNTAPTTTEFTVGIGADINKTGRTYVAYIFADNSSDSSIDAADRLISCGSFSEASSGNTTTVDLGYEPQFVIAKSAADGDNWHIIDSMRGFTATTSGNSRELVANGSGAESGGTYLQPTSTGFIAHPWAGSGGGTIIYMAIRAPMMAEPTTATEVFGIATRDSTEPHFNTSFDQVDFALYRSDVTGSNDWYAATRLTTNKVLVTNSTAAEVDGGTGFVMDFSNGWYGNSGANSNSYSWMWKRAKGYFDCVCYNGTGSNNTQNHSLSVVPEMMWWKRRDSATAGNWLVYHKSYSTNQALFINTNGALLSNQTGNLQSVPTTTQFTVGTYNGVNNSSGTYIVYLFATLAGVSKVGSYTGTGSTQTIDCGFSTGARFILIRNITSSFTSSQRNWLVFDSTRGVVSGGDPYLYLNSTSAQSSSEDWIDPHSSGFQVTNTGGNDANANGGTYIFYAIA